MGSNDEVPGFEDIEDIDEELVSRDDMTQSKRKDQDACIANSNSN